MNEKPHRRYQLTLDIGADTYDELLRAIHTFADHMDMNYPALDYSTNGASGGVSTGYSYDVKVDNDMTHERWYEELQAYLAARKAHQPAPESDTP